jgi:hypothetical protein
VIKPRHGWWWRIILRRGTARLKTRRETEGTTKDERDRGTNRKPQSGRRWRVRASEMEGPTEMPFAKMTFWGNICRLKLSYETDGINPWNRTHPFSQHGQRTCRRLLFLAVLAGGIRNACYSQHSRGTFFSYPYLRVCAAGLPIRLRVPAAAASGEPSPSPNSTRDQRTGHVNLRAGFALGPQLAWRRSLGS